MSQLLEIYSLPEIYVEYMAQVDPVIVEAQRMEEGVIVTFDSGACAIYSAALLYSIFDQAEDVSGLVREADRASRDDGEPMDKQA